MVESQRMGRDTCNMISGVNSNNDEIYRLCFRSNGSDRCQGCKFIVLGAVTQVEVVGTDGVAFCPDAEQFGLDAVFHVVVLDGENFVQGFLEETAVFKTVDGLILATVVYPEVHHTG